MIKGTGLARPSRVQIPLWTILTRYAYCPGQGRRSVQIPLWTIVTAECTSYTGRLIMSSDSSMDDCNKMKEKYYNVKVGSSDSSMDDCNPIIEVYNKQRGRVQIPLWTIVTSMLRIFSEKDNTCSDSSMDDCNCVLSVGIRCPSSSDSSMDDCNVLRYFELLTNPLFRFLYGRL